MANEEKINGTTKFLEDYIADVTKEIEAEKKELVKAPQHYADRKYQTILVIEDSLSLDEMKGYCKGNVLKYVSRAGKKDKTAQDLKKARTYLEWLIQLEEEGKLKDVPTYNERKD
jgi:hypothetical protein